MCNQIWQKLRTQTSKDGQILVVLNNSLEMRSRSVLVSSPRTVKERLGADLSSHALSHFWQRATV